VTLFPAGGQEVTSRRTRDPADFCRKTRAGFGAEVYRSSTGVSDLGKSSGKDRYYSFEVSVLPPRHLKQMAAGYCPNTGAVNSRAECGSRYTVQRCMR